MNAAAVIGIVLAVAGFARDALGLVIVNAIPRWDWRHYAFAVITIVFALFALVGLAGNLLAARESK